MPLVCLEGLSLFQKMGSHALLITKHSCNAISSFWRGWPWIELYFRVVEICFISVQRLLFFFPAVACTCLCNVAPPHPFKTTWESKWEICKKTTALSSPCPCAQYTDRQLHKVKDKGRQRKASVVQWEGEIQSNGYHTNCVSSNDISLTLFWASWHISVPLRHLVFASCTHCTIFVYVLCLILPCFQMLALSS